MATTLLHVTLANHFLKTANNAALYRYTEGYLADFQLGAVFVDLSYYDNIIINGVKKALNLPIAYHSFGNSLHANCPTTLSLNLLKRARSLPQKAFALGHLTHYAVDIVFHKEIHRRVHQRLANHPNFKKNILHGQIEDQFDSCCHRQLLGHTGMGTAYARCLLKLRPTANWAHHAHLSLPPNTVTHKKLNQWLKNLKIFSMATSFRHSPWVKMPQSSDRAFEKCAAELIQEATTMGLTFLKTGTDFLNALIDEDTFFNQIVPRSMADGSPISTEKTTNKTQSSR